MSAIFRLIEARCNDIRAQTASFAATLFWHGLVRAIDGHRRRQIDAPFATVPSGGRRIGGAPVVSIGKNWRIGYLLRNQWSNMFSPLNIAENQFRGVNDARYERRRP